MKRIFASIMGAAVILVFLLQLNIQSFDEGSIFVDDAETEQNIDQQELYDELFDISSVIKISVDISSEELAKIQSDYEYYKNNGSKSPIYRMASSVIFDINGKKYVIKEVGVRMKGNVTRTNFYNDLLGIYNLVSFRLSFNETFDDSKDYAGTGKRWGSDEERNQRLNRTFATLQNLEVKWNSSFDNTYTRSVYASAMFRNNGVLAQKCHLVSFEIGGCESGVYNIYEPVDEIFINRYLPESEQGGDLYKVNWADGIPVDYTLNNTYGVADKKKAKFYNFELKTNQDLSQHEYIQKFLSVINDDSITKNKLESIIDIDYFMRFCALNYLMGNQDDMRNNYNNHYVYFRPSDGKAIFIPYDNERCFGCVYAWNHTDNEVTKVSPYSSTAEGAQVAQTNPLIINTVTEKGLYKDEYTKYLREFSTGKWVTVENFDQYYNKLKDNYSGFIISDTSFFSTNGHNLEFSMEGGSEYNDNLSIREFMESIKATTEKYIGSD